jgi:hypothetical protein
MKTVIFTTMLLLMLYGCTSHPVTVTPKCRHLALFGAITWANMTGDMTTIAIGPTAKSEWHAQAAVIDRDYVIRRWLVWNGKSWEVGKRENFTPFEFLDVREFFSKTISGRYGGSGFKYQRKTRGADEK